MEAPPAIRAHKRLTERNPIMTHTFGADPSALVYNGRVYLYMTADTLEYDSDGEIKSNSYNTINTIRVVSSADLSNWIYHEPIKAAGSNGIADWAQRSWAPAITYRNMDGQDKFFLYFANNASGVGVLTADSPLGPWSDPIGRALVSRQTPNCSGVPWLFDPGVFVDDDGRAYLYFGGGVPEGRAANPGSARVVELGADMTSLIGDPVQIDIPYFFEAILMKKINGRYVLSYCTNWSVAAEDRQRLGINNAVIAVMTANNPMGPFTLEGTLFRNPGSYFDVWGNNHHDMFNFEGQWYLAYHSQLLEESMGIDRKGYRVAHVDRITMADGIPGSANGTLRGVEQVGRLDPYDWHPGALSGISAGTSFESIVLSDASNPCEYASALTDGAWLGVFGADFSDRGAANINILARAGQTGGCVVEVRLGSPFSNSQDSELIGTLSIRNPVFTNYTVRLTRTVTDVQNIYFVYSDSFALGGWQFTE